MRDLAGLSLVIAIALAMSGCGGAAGGDPGAKSLPYGESCGSIKSQMDKLIASGVQSAVEKQTNGGKLSQSEKAAADSYNRLLNDYLGARCHV